MPGQQNSPATTAEELARDSIQHREIGKGNETGRGSSIQRLRMLSHRNSGGLEEEHGWSQRKKLTPPVHPLPLTATHCYSHEFSYYK